MAETMSSNSCRICMSSKMHHSSIFSNDLSRKITEIADVEVQEGDGLPPTICEDCEVDLDKCYKFRVQIQWADSKFRENLSVSEVVFEECQIKQEIAPMHPFMNEDNQDNEDDDDDRGPSDNDDDDYDMREEPEDKTENADKEGNQVTHPLDHVEIIENRTKQEIHMPLTDQNSQEEPLIVAQNMKSENEPTTDPLMHNEPQSMETDNILPGPSTSAPMVCGSGNSNQLSKEATSHQIPARKNQTITPKKVQMTDQGKNIQPIFQPGVSDSKSKSPVKTIQIDLPKGKESVKKGNTTKVKLPDKTKKLSTRAKANLVRAKSPYLLPKIAPKIAKPITIVKKRYLVKVAPTNLILNHPQTMVVKGTQGGLVKNTNVGNLVKVNLSENNKTILTGRNYNLARANFPYLQPNITPKKPKLSRIVKDHVLNFSSEKSIANHPQTVVVQDIVCRDSNAGLKVNLIQTLKGNVEQPILNNHSVVNSSNLQPKIAFITKKPSFTTAKELVVVNVPPTGLVLNSPQTAASNEIECAITSKAGIPSKGNHRQDNSSIVNFSNLKPKIVSNKATPSTEVKNPVLVNVSPENLIFSCPQTAVVKDTTVRVTSKSDTALKDSVEEYPKNNFKTTNLPPNVLMEIEIPYSSSAPETTKYDKEAHLIEQAIQMSPTIPNNPVHNTLVISKPSAAINKMGKMPNSFYNRQKTKSIANDGEVSFKVHNATTCFVCNIKYTNHELLLKHLAGESFFCRVCVKECNDHSDLETHFTSHDGRKCLTCKKVFFCNKDIKQHFRDSESCKHEVDNRAKFRCEVCKMSFVREKAFILHKTNKHANGESYQCVVCLMEFPLSTLLLNHAKKKHVAYEHVVCKVCDKTYLGPDKLKHHMQNTHFEIMKNETFLCEYCSKVFQQEKNLKIHLRTHDQTEVICEQCGKTIVGGKPALQAHVRYKHATTRKVYSCTVCSEQFTALYEYRKHRNSHQQNSPQALKYICEICSKSYKTLGILKKHYEIHSNERNYKCNVCDASFKQAVTLKTHSRIHSDTPKYVCEHCSQPFRWPQTFQKHVNQCRGQPAENSDSNSD